MSDSRITMVLLMPVILGAVACFGYVVQGMSVSRGRLSERIRSGLNILGLVAACVGLLVGPLLAILTQGEADVASLGVSLAVSPLARVGLAATSVSLLCAIIVSWSSRMATQVLRMVSAVMFVASLLWGALLVTDRLVSALCLFGAALVVSVIAAFPLVTVTDVGAEDSQGFGAKLLEGGWKHIAMAVVATGLLITGMLMVARHSLNLENPGTLQVGLGLISVGLVMRAGAMPFATSSTDLTEAAPEAAILMLGAISPTVIIIGLLTFAPLGAALTEVSPAERQVALGLGAVGALLAGVRALASSEALGTREARLAVLVSSSVALQIGWALFGVFSGSRPGTLGAALLAVNLALGVPLIIASREKIGKGVGAGALLGLPPLGGFVGTMLVAQAAVEINGAWLLGLVLGSAGVALAWLRAIDWLRPSQEASPPTKDDEQVNMDEGHSPTVIRHWSIVGSEATLLCRALVAAQLAWFVLSFFIVI